MVQSAMEEALGDIDGAFISSAGAEEDGSKHILLWRLFHKTGR
jgi:hypothetical protein